MDGTASSPSLALVTVPSSGTVNAAPALVAGGVQVQLSFWTSCDKCHTQHEYAIEFKNRRVICPQCHVPFLARKKELNLNNGSNVKVIRRHPKKVESGGNKEKMVEKNSDVVSNIESAILPQNIEHEINIGPPHRDVLSPSTETWKPVAKRQKGPQQQIDTHQVYHGERSRKFFGHHEEASPEDIFAALKEIPNLARDDLLTAYSSLTQDNHMFRSLMALPLDMRKDWLLMENRFKMARMKSIMFTSSHKDMF